MEASTTTISSIFNGRRVIEVPFYQRHYVWGEGQWQRFLDDMMYITHTNTDYFLGSTILKQQKTSVGESYDLRTVIDGQQRFTTFILFAKSLCLKTNDADTFNRYFTVRSRDRKSFFPALAHSLNDRKHFNEVIATTTDSPIDSKPSRIIDCYNYFQRHIDESKLDLDTILSHCLFIAIDLGDADDEQVIFDTINSLGMRLTTAELLKNYFFSEESQEQYEKIWKPTFEKDDQIVAFWNKGMNAGRSIKTHIDEFFYAFLNIKIQDADLNVDFEHKAIYRRADSLFSSYKDLISSFGLTKNQLMKDITEYAQVYYNIFKNSADSEELTQATGIDRIHFIIEELEISTLIPYVLYVQKNVESLEERNKIYDYLESYIIRRQLCRSNNKSYSDLFTENLIGGHIDTYDALVEYMDMKKENIALGFPTDEQLNQCITEIEFPNKRALVILYLLESKIRNGKPHATHLYPFADYTLEHLMPKKYEKNWPLTSGFNQEGRIHYIQTIGNMTLLPQKLNTSISNADWKKKMSGNDKIRGLRYYATDIETLREILSKRHWDEKEIMRRSSYLANSAQQVWKFHSKSSSSDSSNSIVQGQPKHRRCQYSIDGGKFLSMSAFVRELVYQYVLRHPEKTYAEIKAVFNDQLCAKSYRFIGLLCTEEEYSQWQYPEKYKVLRYKSCEPKHILSTADGFHFYVNTQWTIDAIPPIIRLAEQEGFSIKCKEL